jgi:hypothetical protein
VGWTSLWLLTFIRVNFWVDLKSGYIGHSMVVGTVLVIGAFECSILRCSSKSCSSSFLALIRFPSDIKFDLYLGGTSLMSKDGSWVHHPSGGACSPGSLVSRRPFSLVPS